MAFPTRFRQDSDLLQRPMMLKDFLRDDGSVSCTTSSSNAFPTYPIKKQCKSTAVVPSKPPIVLLRSWSKKAGAATKITAIVKLLQFASLKSPSVIPRSFSRKLTKRRRRKDEDDLFDDVSEVKVKVKDILRWRSFRDVVEEKSTPLDLSSSPDRSTIAATTTSSCSKRSSWCDSDFTAEELPPWGGEKEEFWGKNAATLRNSKGDWQFEESDQKSPVSVLDSPFTQVEDFNSPFHPILTNIQKAECNTLRNHEPYFEEEFVGFEVEEKAKQLLSYVKEGNVANDEVILDFFVHELSINGKLQSDELDSKILRIARSWINDELDESYEWEVEKKRASYIEDMEKGITCWNKFNEEQQEVSMELGFEILDDLIHDLLNDFLVR